MSDPQPWAFSSSAVDIAERRLGAEERVEPEHCSVFLWPGAHRYDQMR